jgi:hypothetical protein
MDMADRRRHCDRVDDVLVRRRALHANGATRTISRETKVEASAYIEYGLRDWLTIFAQIAPERYAMAAPVSNTYSGLDYTTAGLRARVLQLDAFVVSIEGAALIPGAHDALRPAQAGNTGFNADARIQAGYSFSAGAWPAFADSSLGYRLREDGPPNEWRFDATFGVRPLPKTLLMLQSFNAISNGPGNAMFPAEQTHVAEASVVYDITDQWSLQTGVYTSIWVVNANRETGVQLAAWRRF